VRTPLLIAAAVGLSVRCASAPSTTDGQRALARNARAVLAGRLVDSAGDPIANMRVDPVPLARDVLYSPSATTDAEGRFELTLFAPASYTLLLCKGEICVITPDPRDVSRMSVTVYPGERAEGIELRFSPELWNDVARDE
jgi:hypothetical protein